MTMFGTFLISRNVASATQIVGALDVQRSRRAHPAAIAMREGALDANQVLCALDESARSGRHFVDCVVAMGFASAAVMARVQRESEQSAPRLGELLVTMGVLTADELAREVAAFRREHVAGSSPTTSRPTPLVGQGIEELLAARRSIAGRTR